MRTRLYSSCSCFFQNHVFQKNEATDNLFFSRSTGTTVPDPKSRLSAAEALSDHLHAWHPINLCT